MTCLSKRARAGVGDARGWAKRARTSAGDEAKLCFMQSVLALGREGFARESLIRDDVRAAAEWAASAPVEEAQTFPPLAHGRRAHARALRVAQVIAHREAATRRIEKMGAQLWASGECARWFNGCDPAVARVSESVNGPLLRMLARECDHPDSEVVEFFRQASARLARLGDPRRRGRAPP